MTAIVLYGLRESLRRKMFAVVLVLTALFLALYAYGTHEAFKDTRGFAGPGQGNLDSKALAGAIVFGLAMFAILFLGAVLAVFLTLNVVRGDAEAGLLQPLVVRPIGRAQLLLARFAGAAGVCVLYVLIVYFAALGITDWAGGWTRTGSCRRASSSPRPSSSSRPSHSQARSSSRRSRTGSRR